MKRQIRIALVAYRDDGELLQLVPLGSVAKPLPVGDLLAAVRHRISAVTVGHVLRFRSPRRRALSVRAHGE